MVNLIGHDFLIGTRATVYLPLFTKLLLFVIPENVLKHYFRLQEIILRYFKFYQKLFKTWDFFEFIAKAFTLESTLLTGFKRSY
jgi:hypothetical protein